MTLLRGNHEDPRPNERFGFKDEVMARFVDPQTGRRHRRSAELYEAIQTVWSWLPLAARIERKILCVHGGIGQRVHSLDDIRAITRPLASTSGARSRVVEDLLWSDPTPRLRCGRRDSTGRGAGLLFGPEIVDRFCARNRLELIIRAHQVQKEGWAVLRGGRCITVFSAPHYAGREKNAGRHGGATTLPRPFPRIG